MNKENETACHQPGKLLLFKWANTYRGGHKRRTEMKTKLQLTYACNLEDDRRITLDVAKVDELDTGSMYHIARKGEINSFFVLRRDTHNEVALEVTRDNETTYFVPVGSFRDLKAVCVDDLPDVELSYEVWCNDELVLETSSEDEAFDEKNAGMTDGLEEFNDQRRYEFGGTAFTLAQYVELFDWNVVTVLAGGEE